VVQLKANLQDPARRFNTLINLQTYARNGEAPWEAALEERWRVLLARADVKEAIEAVGRINTFDIASPMDRGRLGRQISSINIGRGVVNVVQWQYKLDTTVSVRSDGYCAAESVESPAN
jgi:hypothetical protein